MVFLAIIGQAATFHEPARASLANVDERARIKQFALQVEDLRRLLKIPALSGAIVHDERVVWSAGFGYRDAERRIPATPNTTYRVESLTKPFASTILLQLVREGKLSLDDPMSKYLPEFKGDAIKIRHVLTHTSGGAKPGDRYRYSGSRFALLTDVIEKATGQTFRDLLIRRVLQPLGMTSSVPGEDVFSDKRTVATLTVEDKARYRRLLAQEARPYILYGADEMIRIQDSPGGISTAAGLVTTVLDFAKFDAAIDRYLLLSREQQEQAFTPAVSSQGVKLPYALGWFVQQYEGKRLIWHYGLSNEYSSLILKVPEENVTLILLASGEALSAPFELGFGDILKSPFACIFLRLFTMRGDTLAPLQEAGSHTDTCEINSRKSIAAWLDAKKKSARRTIKIDPKALDAYLGQYRIQDTIVVFKRVGHHLIMTVGTESIEEVYPEAENRFFLKTQNIQFEFVKDANGKVIRIDYTGDARGTARRIN
jgi:CubicO group peptidase (beta-lactamase class C family)